jgi:hypothetical protein
MSRNMRETRWVLQDGNDFYIYRDAGLTDLQTTWTSKRHIRDLADAQRAREDCIAQLQIAGYDIEWPNPFGGE